MKTSIVKNVTGLRINVKNVVGLVVIVDVNVTRYEVSGPE